MRVMNRITTTSLFVLVAFAFLVGYRFAGQSDEHREVTSRPGEGAPLIFPAVSEVWSTADARSAQVAQTVQAVPSISQVGAVVMPDVPVAEPPNSVRMQARVKDLLARLSTDSLGIDPEAEQYWLAAINDSNIEADDRRELILALETAGFADPTSLSADDLPLIAGRIALVEELAPNAIDNVNAAALQEVYQTLVSMLASIAPENGTVPSAAE